MPILIIICVTAFVLYVIRKKLGWRKAFSRGLFIVNFQAGMLLVGGNFVYIAPVWFNWSCVGVGVFATLYQIYYLFYISKHKDVDSVSTVLILYFCSLFFFYYLLFFSSHMMHRMFIGE